MRYTQSLIKVLPLTINSPPCLNIIQSTNNNLELFVKFRILILNLPMVWNYIHPWTTFVDKLCSTFSLGMSDVLGSEKELTVEICNINGVWFYYYCIYQQWMGSNERSKYNAKIYKSERIYHTTNS